MPEPSSPPTLYEWAGGMPALQRLTGHFYERVRVDPVLATVFAQMSGDHPSHVAQFIAEVLGGPSTYSTTRGGHPHMITQQLNRHLTQEQRRRWLELLLASADATGLPCAVAVVDAPMPKWDWGVPGGPYRG